MTTATFSAVWADALAARTTDRQPTWTRRRTRPGTNTMALLLLLPHLLGGFTCTDNSDSGDDGGTDGRQVALVTAVLAGQFCPCRAPAGTWSAIFTDFLNQGARRAAAPI